MSEVSQLKKNLLITKTEDLQGLNKKKQLKVSILK